MLKRDFTERTMGQGPVAKRRDLSGAQGRLVCLAVVCFKIITVLKSSEFLLA